MKLLNMVNYAILPIAGTSSITALSKTWSDPRNWQLFKDIIKETENLYNKTYDIYQQVVDSKFVYLMDNRVGVNVKLLEKFAPILKSFCFKVWTISIIFNPEISQWIYKHQDKLQKARKIWENNPVKLMGRDPDKLTRSEIIHFGETVLPELEKVWTITNDAYNELFWIQPF